uniref:Cyclin-like domain-containing protein n=1 Tax=Ditylenchus dipsaci TaxID=166011 RepID=A0A915DUP1_9BILA
MSDGPYTLSSVLLHSLLHKEQNVKLCASLSSLNESSNKRSSVECCVSSAERDTEVRWICAIGRKLGLGLNTVGLTIAILDRILCTVLVRSKYINCVAVAALYLAVKLHEEYNSDEVDDNEQENSKTVLDAAHLVSKLKLHYSVAELNRMERSLLRVLNWDLMLPSCDRFLQAMLVVIGAPHLAESLVLRENFESVVSEWQLVCAFRPSILALSLLSLMLQMSSPEWFRITQSLKQIFQVDEMQFMKCRSQMAEVLQRQHLSKQNSKIHKSKNIDTQTFDNLPACNKSRKRSRQAFVDDLANDDYYFSNNASKEDDEDEAKLKKDVLHVLYNILNAQQD